MRTNRAFPLALHPAKSGSREVLLPVVTAVCVARCGEPVNLDDHDTYFVSRVGGDSANGYEPTHVTCDLELMDHLSSGEDEHPLDAAMREAYESIGLPFGPILAGVFKDSEVLLIGEQVVDTWAGTLERVRQVNASLIPDAYSWDPEAGR